MVSTMASGDSSQTGFFGGFTFLNEVSFPRGSATFFELEALQANPIVTSSFGAAGSYQLGSWIAVGGDYQGDTWFEDQSVLDGDVMIEPSDYLVYQGDVQAEAVYFGIGNQLEHSRRFTVYMYHNSFYGVLSWYGPGSMNTAYGQKIGVQADDGLNWSHNVLLTGRLTIDEHSTACSFNPASSPPAYTCGITINQANIDAAIGKALINPQTGSGFFSE